MTYTLKHCRQYNTTINNLPIPQKRPSAFINQDNESIDVPGFKDIVLNGRSISRVSNQYHLVSHKDSFAPVIEGLTVAGIKDWEFRIISTDAECDINIYINKGFDGIRYGFKVSNSYTGRSAMRYGFKSFHAQKYIEIVGYRQVCENGMVIRVPLEDAEFVKNEERTKITKLLTQAMRVGHLKGEVETKLPEVQYIVEAMILLKKPMERIIKKAKKWTITNDKEMRNLISKYIGKRYTDAVMEQYANEEKTLWGFYNAATYVGSHNQSYKEKTKDQIASKAGNMLDKLLRPEEKIPEVKLIEVKR